MKPAPAASVARIERSEIRDMFAPHFASLNAGYRPKAITHAASAGLTRFALATLDILDDVLRKLAPPPDLLTNLTGARKPAAALGRRDPDRLSCRRNRVDRDSEAV